jgi:hypothetical protein
VGVSFTMTLAITGEVEAAAPSFPAPGPGAASGISTATLALEVGQPVFELPAGYTGNSSNGRIVDDIFLGPPPPVPALSPIGWLALVGSLVGLGVARRGFTTGSVA